MRYQHHRFRVIEQGSDHSMLANAQHYSHGRVLCCLPEMMAEPRPALAARLRQRCSSTSWNLGLVAQARSMRSQQEVEAFDRINIAESEICL